MTGNGDNIKVAYLGMPANGMMTVGAARGFYMPAVIAAKSNARHRIHRVIQTVENSSLLDGNCTGLWCRAINAQKNGEQLDYFAMLHSDVQPEDGWLDILIDEMEYRDLDCLSCVIPIKDTRGLTSTALGKPDVDDWGRIFGRITMRELHSLPMTFTAADLGHPDKPLLINTGCFVCRFDWRWAYACKFMSQTRVVQLPNKDFFVETEPEDWHFARCLHRVGLKVGATRRIRLLHCGVQNYTNVAAWGDRQFDSEYQPEPFIKLLDANERFPHDVDGWLNVAEGDELARLGAGKDCLEIGSYCGRSTICLARHAKHVAAVDPFRGEGVPNEPRDTLPAFKENIHRHGVADRVSIHVGTINDLPQNGRFDLAFIDGRHDYESVVNDMVLAARRLKPDGLLVFHDYREMPGQHDGRWDPGVTKAVQQAIAGGGELISTCDSLAVVRPAAAMIGAT